MKLKFKRKKKVNYRINKNIIQIRKNYSIRNSMRILKILNIIMLKMKIMLMKSSFQKKYKFKNETL